MADDAVRSSARVDKAQAESNDGRIGRAFARRAQDSTVFRLTVLSLPFLLAIISIAIGGFSFSSHTSDNNDTPSSVLSHVHKAYSELDASYTFLGIETDGVVIATTDKSPILSSPTTDASAASNAVVAALHSAAGADALVSVSSFFGFNASSTLASLAPAYLSTDGTALLVATELDSNHPEAFGFYGAVPGIVSGVQKAHPKYSMIFTGMLPSIQEDQKTTGKGFAVANGSGLPLIAILFWLRIRSLRLMLLPAIALGLSLCISYGAGIVVAKTSSIEIPSYVPDIALFLALALANDYSFFLLSRFQQERRRGVALPQAVEIATSRSGSLVAVSGIILVFSWLALVAFPVYGLQAVGICSSLSVAACLFTNLTLTPTLLLQFPNFFSKSIDAPEVSSAAAPLLGGVGDGDGDDEPRDTGDNATTTTRRPPQSNKSSKCPSWCKLSDPDAPSCYGSLAKKLTVFPWNIAVPVVMFAILAAGASRLAALKTPVGLEVSYGSGPIATAYGAACNDFPGVGGLRGLFATVVDSAPHAVLRDDVLTTTCHIHQGLVAAGGVTPSTVQSIGVVPSTSDDATPTCISAAEARALLATPSSADTAESALYKRVFASNVASDNSSSIVTFAATDYETYKLGPVVTHARDAIRDAMATAPSTVPSAQLYQPIVVEVDAKDLALARLPWVLLVSFLIIFSLVAFNFKAAFVVVKLLLTLVLPVMFVYGTAVMVFQDGALDWTGIHSLSSTNGGRGISWLVPIATLFLSSGLAIDYELFLLGRIYELRSDPSRGLTTREAVIAGVEQTASIISSGGVILALAFLGMVVNDNRFLNQFGYIMIVGVMLDTFIVRGIAVPAVMSWGEEIQWWPGKMPPAHGATKSQRSDSQPQRY